MANLGQQLVTHYLLQPELEFIARPRFRSCNCS